MSLIKKYFLGCHHFEVQYKTVKTVLGNTKRVHSDVSLLWFQFTLRLRHPPSFGGHNGNMKTKDKKNYKILIYRNESVSIKS